MKFRERLPIAFLAICLTGLMATVASAQQPYRQTEIQTGRLIRRIDNRSHNFQNSLAVALDRSSLNGSAREDEMNNAAGGLQRSADELLRNFEARRLTRADVEALLQQARMLNTFMRDNRLAYAAENNWRLLRSDLDRLANDYYVAWNWTGGYIPPTPSSDWRLTGTYRLNAAMSDNPRTIADRAISGSVWGNVERQQIYDNLVNRLEPPQMLALERSGDQVMLASTRSPEVTLDANGRDYIESYPDGRTSHVRATLIGNQLTVVSNGNRPNDFTATFQPIENGQRLLVTRQMFAERLNRNVQVHSYYDRTSDVAHFNIYQGNSGEQSRTDFVVPDNTMIVATLNNALDTRSAQDFDKFTMTIREPNAYRNAILEGHVSNVDRSGRLAGRANMTLNFDRIRMPNGRSYAFAGVLENIHLFNGEDVRVDNEGAIAERDSQSQTTIERAGIGGAVGALIGAIAGGGKGAAIGAAIGAGAGAGSVYVQGRNDLDLPRGSEVTVRASAPGRL